MLLVQGQVSQKKDFLFFVALDCFNFVRCCGKYTVAIFFLLVDYLINLAVAI